MKKVWILEKFITPEKIKESMNAAKEGLKSDNPEAVYVARLLLDNDSERLLKNPNGYWCGWEGKVIYKQFCECAKNSIRNNPKDTYRVIEAEIKDDAENWLDYKFVKENLGVYKYLRATL